MASGGTVSERTWMCGIRPLSPRADASAAGGRPSIPYNRGMHLLRLAKIWYVSLIFGLDEFLTGHERFRAVRPLARTLTFWRDTSAPRARAAAPRARGAGPDLRQVRPDALDAARPAPARHRRRAREAAGPRAAVPVRTVRRDARRASTASRSRPCSSRSTRRRSPARRSRRCISPSCPTARRSRSRCCGPTSRR